jgi:uncharacterized membrane protein
MWLKKQSLVELFTIAVISILALVLRLWGLSTKEFWYDEAYSGIMVKLPSDKLSELLQFDVHPPVYIYLLRLWSTLLGDSDLTIRLFSVLSGVAVVFASYFLVKSLNISKKHPFAKLVIPLIIAVNPFFVEYSKEARSYSLMALIFSLLFISYYFASKSLKFNLKWFITALMIILAFLTHYLILIGIFSLFLFDAFFTKSKTIKLKEFIIKKTLLYLSLGAIILPPLYLYLPTLLIQYKNAPIMWWIPISDLQRLPTTLYIFMFGVKADSLGIPKPLQLNSFLSPDNIGMLLLIIFTGLISYGLTKYRKNEFKKDLLLLLFCSILPISIVMLLQSFGHRLYLERYLTPYGLIFAVFLGLLIFLFKRSIKYFILGIYIMMSLILIINVKHESAGYAKLAQELKKIDNQEIQVIMPDPISFTVAKYYLSGNQNIKVKIYNPKDDLSDWEIISKNEILKDYNQLKGKQRIWVYNNANKPDIWYRQTTQIDKLYIYSSVILFDNLASKNPL